jgi:DNA-binding winged helix-turn-helix (wHTH) protein
LTEPSPYFLPLEFLLGGTLPAGIIQLDEFELDLGRYELRRGDQVVKLEKSPMELLTLLVENLRQLVTREDIIRRLWGDNVFVDTPARN